MAKSVEGVSDKCPTFSINEYMQLHTMFSSTCRTPGVYCVKK